MSKPKSMMVKTEHIVNGNLWRCFPVINVDKLKDIPVDYPGPMAVPITIVVKYNPEQFEIVGITDNHAQLETGRVPYRRIVIRHLHPQLPEEIDLVEWFDRMGEQLDVVFCSPEDIPADAMLLYRA